MQKKTILHFIFSLQRGGAETMLVRVVKELPEYRNVLLEFYGENSFGDDIHCDKYISMNCKSLLLLPLAIFKLRRIIREDKIDIVHTHLLWPTLVARIATPKRIPLLTTIHTSIGTSLDYRRWYIRMIDKMAFGIRKSFIIGVSKGALKEYFTVLKLKAATSCTLYTFADTEKFKTGNFKKRQPGSKLLLVSVGGLRPGKNFRFLIDRFSEINNPNIELHIYGSGMLETELKKIISLTRANVVLKGEVGNIQEVLPLYDLYVSASAFEGFSLSILEAMAMKLPLLLSDIGSFREQCGDCAVYFDLNQKDDFSEKLNYLISDREKMNCISENAYKRVLENFTVSHHISKLKRIYKETLAIHLDHSDSVI